MQENTSIGVVHPPFGFVWSSNHWWSGRVPTLGRVGLVENSQVQLTSGVTLQPGDFIKAAFFLVQCWCHRKDRPLIGIEVLSFHNQGIYGPYHVMIWKWYVFDMLPPCYFLIYSTKTEGDRWCAQSNRAANLHETWSSSDVGFPRQCLVAEWFEMVWRYPGLPLISFWYIHSITWRDMWVCYFKSCWSFSLLLFFRWFLMSLIAFIYWKSRNVLSYAMSPHQNSSSCLFFRIPFLFFIYRAAKRIPPQHRNDGTSAT